MQFTAVPWMRDHLFSEMTRARRHRRADRARSTTPYAASPRRSAAAAAACSTSSSTPEQKEILDRITGVMSLLEGHADVVMDGVGPTVIPSVDADPQAVQRAPQGRRHPRPHPAPAARPRRQDGAVPRRRRVRPPRRRQGRHGASFNAVWAGPRTCRQGRDRRPRRLDHPRPVSAEPHPAVAAVRPRRTRRARRRSTAGATSSWWPAAAAPTRWRCSRAAVFEGHKRGLRVVGVTVDHGLQAGLRRPGRRGSSSRWPRSAPTRR